MSVTATVTVAVHDGPFHFPRPPKRTLVELLARDTPGVPPVGAEDAPPHVVVLFTKDTPRSVELFPKDTTGGGFICVVRGKKRWGLGVGG